MDWNELLNFRKMITPTVIQVVFWLGIVAVVVGGIWQMTAGGWAILIGLVSIVLGILLVRVYCEIIILLFRIYDSLRNIEGKGSGSLL